MKKYFGLALIIFFIIYAMSGSFESNDVKKDEEVNKQQSVAVSNNTTSPDDLFKKCVIKMYNDGYVSPEDLDYLKIKLPAEELENKWKKYFLETIDSDGVDLKKRVIAVEKYGKLYVELFGNDSKLIKDISYFEDDIKKYMAKYESIKEKYPFDIEKVNDCGTMRLYVVRVLGSNSKVFDAIKDYTSEDYGWLATDVKNTILGEFPDKNKYYVIRTSKDDPYSQSGVYDVKYYTEGETIELTDSDGFKINALVLNKIKGNMNVTDDAYRVSDYVYKINIDLEKIISILSGKPPRIPENEQGLPPQTASSNQHKEKWPQTKPKYKFPAGSNPSDEFETGEFLIPESGGRYLMDEEIQYFKDADYDTVNLAINELYAKHGYQFKMKEFSDYFNSLSWYRPIPGKTQDQINSEFNEYEKSTLETLSNIRSSIK